MEELSEKELGNIVPFSGTPQEMAPMERIIAAGGALQKTQTAYTTAVAVQKPRSISRIAKNVLEEAKLAGPGFFYRWEVKNKKTKKKSIVQGASIDLAMCLARNYGNCALDIEVQETPTHFHFKGSFIDLETGFTVPRLYRQRKKQGIGGGYGDDRAEDIVFQIGQSKAQRNAIIKAAPNWLIEKAIEVAREAEINKIKPEHIALARAKAIEYFERYGITQDRIEAVVERPADQWTAENIVDLKATATALKEGRATPDELFPPIEQEPSADSDQSGDETEGDAPDPDDAFIAEFAGFRKPGKQLRKYGKENATRLQQAAAKVWNAWQEKYLTVIGEEYKGRQAVEEKKPSTETETKNGFAFCPTDSRTTYAGKQVSFAAVCGVCPRKDQCGEYQTYLDFQRGGTKGETLE